MASADSSRALTPEVSPEKVSALSERAVWLYLMRLVDFGLRLFLASSSPASGLSASSCSYGRSFASRFFRLQTSRSVACTSATVTSTSSDDLLSYH